MTSDIDFCPKSLLALCSAIAALAWYPLSYPLSWVATGRGSASLTLGGVCLNRRTQGGVLCCGYARACLWRGIAKGRTRGWGYLPFSRSRPPVCEGVPIPLPGLVLPRPRSSILRGARKFHRGYRWDRRCGSKVGGIFELAPFGPGISFFPQREKIFQHLRLSPKRFSHRRVFPNREDRC